MQLSGGKMQLRQLFYILVFGVVMGLAFKPVQAKELPTNGLLAGVKAPKFELKDAKGKTQSLDGYLKKGNLVMVFYRGGWCPYCNKHLKEIKGSIKEIEKLGAQVVAISVDTPNRNKATGKKNQLGFDLLSDPKAEVVKAYRVVNQVDSDTQKKYRQFGINLSQHSGQNHGIIAVPGVFIVDQTGILRFAEANADYTKRVSPAAILSQLKTMKK